LFVKLPFPSIPCNKSRIVSKNQVYIFGGVVSNKSADVIEVLDLVDETLKPLSGLGTKRKTSQLSQLKII